MTKEGHISKHGLRPCNDTAPRKTAARSRRGAGVCCFALRVWAGNFHQSLNGLVEKLRLLRSGGLVIDLLPLPPCGNQTALAELMQMVGDGRTAHTHQCGQIDHAFLIVAKNPKNFETRPIVQQPENTGGNLKCLVLRYGLRLVLDALSMVMRQLHAFAPLFNPFPINTASYNDIIIKF